jgi:hypothetical protein
MLSGGVSLFLKYWSILFKLIFLQILGGLVRPSAHRTLPSNIFFLAQLACRTLGNFFFAEWGKIILIMPAFFMLPVTLKSILSVPFLCTKTLTIAPLATVSMLSYDCLRYRTINISLGAQHS